MHMMHAYDACMGYEQLLISCMLMMHVAPQPSDDLIAYNQAYDACIHDR